MNDVRRSIGVALLALAAACGGPQKVPMSPTSEAPAAQGTVAVNRTDQGNTKVAVEVHHLAPPEKVAQGARVYVVWAQPTTATGEKKADNIGALTVDDQLTGKLKTLTPLERFDVFVTPEASPNAMTPSNAAVLKAKVAR